LSRHEELNDEVVEIERPIQMNAMDRSTKGSDSPLPLKLRLRSSNTLDSAKHLETEKIIERFQLPQQLQLQEKRDERKDEEKRNSASDYRISYDKEFTRETVGNNLSDKLEEGQIEESNPPLLPMVSQTKKDDKE